VVKRYQSLWLLADLVEVCIVGFFDLLRDGFAEPGTTARLNGELGQSH